PPRDHGPAARAPTVTSIGASPLGPKGGPAAEPPADRTMKLDASRAVRTLDPAPTDELGDDTRRVALAEARAARRRESTALEEPDEEDS
ncbi:hypothetical protein L6R52_37565, partial [Myxococcota bacterium]|nr:hypothetical protein [Myxococcota bacterium]